MSDAPATILGASGRLGRLMQHVAGETAGGGLPLRYLRRSDWDIGVSPPPVLGPGPVLDLAGVTRRPPDENPGIATEVALAARRAGARLLHVSSAAVYPGGEMDMAEDQGLAPPSPYGRSKMAAEAQVRAICPDAVILRLGNVAGADALLGGLVEGRPARLDPVPGQDGGPIRSYIGPRTLAGVLQNLLILASAGADLPPVINIAQPGEVSMASLLEARGHPWHFSPAREGVVARVVLDTRRLQSIMPVAPVSAPGLVAELDQMAGWP